MPSASNWDDLRPRVIWGLAMIAVGVLAIWLGGIWFQMLTVFATAVMIWELSRMIQPDGAAGMLLAVLTATTLSAALALESGAYVALLLAPALAGAAALPRAKLTFAGFALGVMLAGWALITFRDTFGMAWLFWLVICVVVTDVAGYFAGRTFGGPKFWPSISPKKTWSGILAGWLGAAFVGWLFVAFAGGSANLIWVSVVLSFAAQMGDITESAIKRRMGVKDSSDLIPGHGGLFDRFDGLLGAALFMLLISFLIDLPQVHP